MKNLLKLSAMVAVVLAASLTGASRTAFALGSCASLNGRACSPPFSTQPCGLPDGGQGRCVCTSLHTLTCN
jgi:hypothetical protein